MSIHNGAERAVETLASRLELRGRREFEFALETDFPAISTSKYQEIVSAIFALRGDRSRTPTKPEELGRPFVPTKGEAELSQRVNGHGPSVRLSPSKALKEKLKAISLWYPHIDPKLVYEVLGIRTNYKEFERLFEKTQGEVRRRVESGHSFPAAKICSANDTIQRIIELGQDRGVAKNFPPLPAGRIMESSFRPRQEATPPAPATTEVQRVVVEQPAPQATQVTVPSKGRRGRMTRAEEIDLKNAITEKLAANREITAEEAFKEISTWVRFCTFKKYFLKIREQFLSANTETPPEPLASEEPTATEEPMVAEVVDAPKEQEAAEPAPLAEEVSGSETRRTVTFEGGRCNVTLKDDGTCEVSFEALVISPEKAAQLLDIATRITLGI